MTTPIARAALASGEVDIHMEMWQQNWLDDYNAKVAEGKIENLGTTYEGGPQFWVIPQWVHEEYNINTIEDMKANWELFKDPEDPSKGQFINCYTGWSCAVVNEIKMEAYGLTEYYNIMTPGSTGAEDAALEGPQLKKEPVFGYYWSPTQMMEKYDWYILEEPEYNADVWADISAASEDESLRPVSAACAYEVLPVEKGIHPTLKDSAPDIVSMLKKMNVGMWPLYYTTNWSNENEIQNYEKAAVYYLRENEDVWKAWVTSEAYDKIKTAVDDYGPLP
jgi:glycine betaine/proline transport system substrate-binding protein